MAKTDYNKLREEVKGIFKAFEMCYDYSVSPTDGTIEVEVEDGDWKHDHLYLDRVMNDKGFDLTGTNIREESDGDWYTATHFFKKR